MLYQRISQPADVIESTKLLLQNKNNFEREEQEEEEEKEKDYNIKIIHIILGIITVYIVTIH